MLAKQVEFCALLLVNRARRAVGKKSLKRLPKGIPGMADACPLARALNYDGTVTAQHFRLSATKESLSVLRKYAKAFNTKVKRSYMSLRLQLPETLRLFVRLFDDGKFPHLIRKKG